MHADRGASVSANRAGVVIGIGMGMSGVGTSAAAVALPSIKGAFGLGAIGTAWVLGAFVVGVGASAPLYGRLSDRYGTRGPFAVGLVLFAVGSIASALAPNPAVLYLGRGLQGVGAAAFPVLGAITVAARFVGADRTAALARVASLAAGAAVGVLLGGLLDAQFGWRVVMAFPALILLVFPTTIRVATVQSNPASLDRAATVFITVGLVGLVLVLQGTAAGVGVAATGGVLVLLAIASMARHVRRVPDGLLPRAVVSNPVFITTAIAGMAVPGLYYAGMVLVPTGLAETFGWDPVHVGWALVGPSVAGVVIPRLVARLPVSRGWLTPLVLAGGGGGLLVGARFTDHAWALILAFTGTCAAFGFAQGALVDRISTYVDGPRGAVIGSYTLFFFVGGSISSGLCGLLVAVWSPSVAFAVLGLLFVGAGVLLRTTWDHATREVVIDPT